MTDKPKPQYLLDRLNPTPYMRPGRGEYRAFNEDWFARMATRFVVIEVRCSTEPQPEDEPLHIYKRHEPEGDAWLAVVDHMIWQASMGALQPGVWTITIPGTDRKHSFEVE